MSKLRKLFKGVYVVDELADEKDINRCYMTFKTKPKGYGRASKEIRSYIDYLENEVEDNIKSYEELLERANKRIVNTTSFIEDRIEEYANSVNKEVLNYSHYINMLYDILRIIKGGNNE
jgi:archaellum component FlaC